MSDPTIRPEVDNGRQKRQWDEQKARELVSRRESFHTFVNDVTEKKAREVGGQKVRSQKQTWRRGRASE